MGVGFGSGPSSYWPRLRVVMLAVKRALMTEFAVTEANFTSLPIACQLANEWV